MKVGGDTIMDPGADIIIGLVILSLYVVFWVKVFSKAGFSGVLAVVMFVPFLNIALLIYFAFAKWPIQQELERLKQINKVSGDDEHT